MSRVRFSTARDLYESFPEARDVVGEAPTDEDALAFLRGLLAAGKLTGAVAFCSYLLPRREAVSWACGSVRALLPRPEGEERGLRAAEDWVDAPDDEHRQAALAIAAQGDSGDPQTWLAQAAGWSGGLLFAHPQHALPVPPAMTGRAARVAVMLAAVRSDPARRDACLAACVAEAMRLAEQGL